MNVLVIVYLLLYFQCLRGFFVDDFSIEELAGLLTTRKLWYTSSEDPCVKKVKAGVIVPLIVSSMLMELK